MDAEDLARPVPAKRADNALSSKARTGTAHHERDNFTEYTLPSADGGRCYTRAADIPESAEDPQARPRSVIRFDELCDEQPMQRAPSA